MLAGEMGGRKSMLGEKGSRALSPPPKSPDAF